MVPTKPTAQSQSASTAGPSLAARYGVQPTSAKSALGTLVSIGVLNYPVLPFSRVYATIERDQKGH